MMTDIHDMQLLGKWKSFSHVQLFGIPWTEEPGGLQYMGSQSVSHDLATEHTQHIMENRCKGTML